MKIANNLGGVVEAKKVNEAKLPNFYKPGNAAPFNPESEKFHWVIGGIKFNEEVALTVTSNERKNAYIQIGNGWYSLSANFLTVSKKLKTV